VYETVLLHKQNRDVFCRTIEKCYTKRQSRFTTGIGDVSTVERMVISDARFAASGFKKGFM
jgi:hypothetical protein